MWLPLQLPLPHYQDAFWVAPASLHADFDSRVQSRWIWLAGIYDLAATEGLESDLLLFSVPKVRASHLLRKGYGYSLDKKNGKCPSSRLDRWTASVFTRIWTLGDQKFSKGLDNMLYTHFELLIETYHVQGTIPYNKLLLSLGDYTLVVEARLTSIRSLKVEVIKIQ